MTHHHPRKKDKEMLLAIVSILVLKGAKESVDWFEDVSTDAAGESEEP